VIAAGGTAGHVVPALAVAEALRAEGAEVQFVGGARAETELVPAAGFTLHQIRVEGLSRTNPLRALRALALALAADIRIAAKSARMNCAFIKLGLGGCDIGTSYFLPRLVGVSVASELILTGRFIGAERALAVGLVSEVVEEGSLEAAAESYVEAMMTASPIGLRLSKECLNMSVDASSLEAAIAMEDRNQVLCSRSDDFNEGITAFLEKRKPVYTNR